MVSAIFFFPQSKLLSWAGKLWIPERKFYQRRFPLRPSSGNWPIWKTQQVTRKIPPGLFFPLAQDEWGSPSCYPWTQQPASPGPPSGSVWALGCFGDGLVSCEIVLAAPKRHFSCLQAWMLRGEHSNGDLVPAAKHGRSVCQHLSVPVKQFLSKAVPQHLPFFKDKCTFLLSKNHLKLFKIWELLCLSFAKKMYIAHHLYRANMNTFSQPEV